VAEKSRSNRNDIKKIIFIADFFKNDLLGGAESNDSVLIDFLYSCGHSLKKLKCCDVDSTLWGKDYFFIISNFVSLAPKHHEALHTEDYIIYEHDHKYLISRDPSIYKNFVAPSSHVINRDFYKNARAVVVLSTICKQVMEKNLDIDNIYNIGCSLWSNKKLDLIAALANRHKNEKFVILDSSNPIKSTPEAIHFCEHNNIEFEVVPPCSESELLVELSYSKGLVFFPKVLETFSRICAEAKMLNCKLITKPNLLGFASEKIFELSGTELIEQIRDRKNRALRLFSSFM